MAARYHYLDAARGILMILGIVYHAARVYGDAGWLVSNETTSPVFDRLASALHSFRMPAFFLMSGFFAGLSLARLGPAEFLRKRAARIAVPFLTALFTLNLLQLYLVRVYTGVDPGGLRGILNGTLWTGVAVDDWISHLWFLVCLAYYFVATALAVWLLGDRGRAALRGAARATRLSGHPAALLLLLPLGNVAVLVAFSLAPGLYTLRPLISLDTVASYVPFFAAGLAAFASRRFSDALTRFSPGVMAVSVAVIAIEMGGWVDRGGAMTRLAAAYLAFLGNWAAVYWVLVGFRALLDRPYPMAVGLADAAYTIYLFHHLTVLVLAWWLRGVHVTYWVEFPLLMAVTFVLTLLLHRLVIRRSRLLGLLFNGRNVAAKPANVAAVRAGAA